MKTAGFLALGTIPGVLFGYALLAGLLMKKVAPVPIVAIPQPQVSATASRPAHRPAAV